MYKSLLLVGVFLLVIICYSHCNGEPFEGTFLDDDEEMNIVGDNVDNVIENVAYQEETGSFVNTIRRIPYTQTEIKNAIADMY
jgi:hypothetical protein